MLQPPPETVWAEKWRYRTSSDAYCLASPHSLSSPIYGELLIGDPGGREQLLTAYQMMYRVPAVRHSEVVEFVRARQLYGQGIGWIDAHLLVSAVVANVPLWTADEKLANLASALEIGYGPSA